MISDFTLSNLSRINKNDSEVIIQFQKCYRDGKGRKHTSTFCPPISKLRQELLRLPMLLIGII